MARWTTTRASASNGALRVGAPFALESRIEFASWQPGNFHGEQVVACSYPGAAVMHYLGRCAPCEDRFELLSQFRGSFERPRGRKIVVAEAVARTGNAAGHRIDRLVFAAEARRGARIDEKRARFLDVLD